jgi:hypothetical protein
VSLGSTVQPVRERIFWGWLKYGWDAGVGTTPSVQNPLFTCDTALLTNGLFFFPLSHMPNVSTARHGTQGGTSFRSDERYCMHRYDTHPSALPGGQALLYPNNTIYFLSMMGPAPSDDNPSQTRQLCSAWTTSISRPCLTCSRVPRRVKRGSRAVVRG